MGKLKDVLLYEFVTYVTDPYYQLAYGVFINRN